jgi:hypothetical protein
MPKKTAHEGEPARPAPSGEQRRLLAVKGLLDEDPSAPSLDDFDLERHHLGILAWGEEPQSAVRGLAAPLERPTLITGPVGGVYWAWLSGSRPFDLHEERLLERFEPAPGSALALGQPAYGAAGFRASHRQARRARWASCASEQPLVRYAQVAAVSLASENESEARRFVARELRGIEDDSPDSQRIRETLIAYFAAEHNAASAAARLGIHQQTVANRLRAVEQRLGRPVGSRRLELELALRLRDTFAGIDG